MYRRSESMIALRARRAALHIAREIVYPRIAAELPDSIEHRHDEAVIEHFDPDSGHTPRVVRWTLWLVIGFNIVVATVAALLISHRISGT